jgi:hypothetical protein
MARNNNIFNLIRGDKFDGPQVTLTINEDDGSTPKDMTGTVVRSQIRDKVDGGELTFEFTITPNTSTVGIVEFTLSAAGTETASWPTGQLYGDIQIQGPGDFGPYTFAKYVVKVEPDVTQ